MVVDIIVTDAKQVERAPVGDVEFEFAVGAGFRARLLLHPLSKLEQNHIIAGRWPAGSPVCDNAGYRPALRQRGHRTCPENNNERKVLHSENVLLQAETVSSFSISASKRAASASIPRRMLS